MNKTEYNKTNYNTIILTITKITNTYFEELLNHRR